MERIITNKATENHKGAISYETAATGVDKDYKEAEDLCCCSQLLKNLIKTNLKLVKMNELSSILLF